MLLQILNQALPGHNNTVKFNLPHMFTPLNRPGAIPTAGQTTRGQRSEAGTGKANGHSMGDCPNPAATVASAGRRKSEPAARTNQQSSFIKIPAKLTVKSQCWSPCPKRGACPVTGTAAVVSKKAGGSHHTGANWQEGTTAKPRKSTTTSFNPKGDSLRCTSIISALRRATGGGSAVNSPPA